MEDREIYAQLLMQAVVANPRNGIGSIILNVASTLCADSEPIYLQFKKDVESKRTITK